MDESKNLSKTYDPKQVEAIKVGNVVKVKVLTSSGVDLDSRFTFLERKF